jgi:hypothetical protein
MECKEADGVGTAERLVYSQIVWRRFLSGGADS